MRIVHDLLMNMRGINTFITDDLLQECGTSCHLVRMSSLTFSKAASYLLMFYTFLKFFLNILHYFCQIFSQVMVDNKSAIGWRERGMDRCLFVLPARPLNTPVGFAFCTSEFAE